MDEVALDLTEPPQLETWQIVSEEFTAVICIDLNQSHVNIPLEALVDIMKLAGFKKKED